MMHNGNISLAEDSAAVPAETGISSSAVLDSLPHPVIMVDRSNRVSYVNLAAESFFSSSASFLTRHKIKNLVPFGTPVLNLIAQVRRESASINEYKVDISSPRLGRDKIVDIYASPVSEQPGSVVLMLQQRTMAEKIDRQLTHRGAARSVTGLAAMLAHEIKNPLSGIRGAAQLLEMSANGDDRTLTRLITDEADRIVKLVDRMEVFSDDRPIERAPVNIHAILERVKTLARTGFARNIRIVEAYDPSLPPVYGNRDQLVQVFLNLVKNAAEALDGAKDAEIVLSTAFRPGIHLSVPGSSERISLPLEFCVTDNGPGVSDDMRTYLFEPFVTSKANGSGLGLALVAKIVGDHGGVIECNSEPRKTVFRILLPAWRGKEWGDDRETDIGEAADE
jgi:two-component system, NtrC family, nitrogen regulation sensor histidine kinase GlnL